MTPKAKKSTLPMSLLALAALIMATPQKAAAYVDPGGGALIWQIAAAAVFGSLFRIHRVANWVRSHLAPRSAQRVAPPSAGPAPLSPQDSPRGYQR
jgi:hypothetical protein